MLKGSLNPALNICSYIPIQKQHSSNIFQICVVEQEQILVTKSPKEAVLAFKRTSGWAHDLDE